MDEPLDPASAGPHDAWNDGMLPRSTKDMNVKEVREMDPQKTSIYTQGVLVRDGMAPATEADAADNGRTVLEGNGLNDLLRWSISNAKESDLSSLRERVARGEYDPTAYREYLDAILGEGDLAKMRNHLKVLVDDARDEDARVGALEEMEFLAESIDNANDLLKIGGLKTVIDCLGRPGTRVPKAGASVLATCMQNNPKCQTAALAAGIVHTLLAGLIGDDPRQKALTASFLYALSASVRGHPPSARVLVDAGGIALLATVALSADERARRRALFLLTTLVEEAPHSAWALREAGDSAQAVLDALEHDDTELQAHALALMHSSLQGEAVPALERVACRDWWRARGIVSALQDLANRLLLRLAAGEKSDDDDPAVPLQIAQILSLLNEDEPLGAPPAPPPPKAGQLPALAEDEAEATERAAGPPAAEAVAERYALM